MRNNTIERRNQNIDLPLPAVQLLGYHRMRTAQEWLSFSFLEDLRDICGALIASAAEKTLFRKCSWTVRGRCIGLPGTIPWVRSGPSTGFPLSARKFREGEKVIAEDAIKGICELTDSHPF